ncbi:MAG: hypothetical protein ABSH51_25045 [Solirubrobacteraceae bacterium]|jgi:hypothetical protein
MVERAAGIEGRSEDRNDAAILLVSGLFAPTGVAVAPDDDGIRRLLARGVWCYRAGADESAASAGRSVDRDQRDLVRRGGRLKSGPEPVEAA